MSEPASVTSVGLFGVRLRQWRASRGLSQLALATRAGSTPRHISFLETGRSRHGRGLVLRLADVLDLSLRDRNQLLESAVTLDELRIEHVYPQDAAERFFRDHTPPPMAE